MAAKKGGMATGVEVARISVKVSPDTSKFRSELKRNLEAIEGSTKAEIEVDLKLNAAQAVADLRRLLLVMQGIADANPIRVGVELDRDRDLTDFMKAMKKAGSSGGGGGGSGKNPLIPSFGSGVNPAGYAVIAAGLLTVIAPLVGLITTSLLALPGLLSLVLTPIGAISLGLSGLMEAAQVLQQPFLDLQSVMSEAAKTRFTPVLESLKPLFTLAEEHLPNVTNAVGDIAQAMADVLVSEDGQAKIAGVIDDIANGLRAMAPGFADFTDGLLGITKEFTAGLPGIADWFNGATASFKNWVNEMESTGQLKDAFSGLGDTLKIILDTLGQLAEKGIEFVSDPEKLETFKTTLEGIGTAIETVMDMSSGFYDFLRETYNVLGGFNKILQGDFSEGWDQLSEGLFPSEAKAEAKGDKTGRAYANATINGANARFGNGDAVELPEIDPNPDGAFGGSFGDVAAGADKAKASVDGLAESVEKVKQNAEGKLTGGIAGALAPGGGDAQVPPPDTSQAEAKVTEYQQFVTTVTDQVKGALSQATTGETLPAPDFAAFKQAWDELPTLITTKGDEMAANAAQIPPKIGESLAGMQAIGFNAGAELMNGLANGITAHMGVAMAAAANAAAATAAAAKAKLDINSPSRVFEEIGMFTAQGMAVGLDKGFQPVLAQAQDLAGQISAAFAEGTTDPTAMLNGYSAQDVKRMEKTLALEIKKLETQAKALEYQAKTTGNDALQARAKEIRQQKEQLSLQKDMLSLTNDYNDTVGGGGGEDPFVKAASGLMNAPVDFAKATGKQFLSDLGISGNGLISKAITEGISYVFNIGSVDEAMSIKDREESKQALSVVGRQ